MSSWKVDDEEVKVGRQWWRALKVALSKERLEVEERVMGKELRAEVEVQGARETWALTPSRTPPSAAHCAKHAFRYIPYFHPGS